MKRKLLLILSALLPMVASAFDACIDGIYYDFSEDKAEVVGGGSRVVVIPEYVTHDGRNYRVTSIGDRAFYEYTAMTSISLPESVVNIGKNAFEGCTNLAYINISENVTNIGQFAFNKCSSLTSIIIPDGITCINKYAFSGCKSLSSVTMGNNVTDINEAADVNNDSKIDIADFVTILNIMAEQ